MARNELFSEQDALVSSVFSDETELFRSPCEPEKGDRVTIRLRLRKGTEAEVILQTDHPDEKLILIHTRADGVFDWYETSLVCGDKPICYTFEVNAGDLHIFVDRRGARLSGVSSENRTVAPFRIIPGFHVPAWSRGALQYQILTDRFRNGNPDNDVKDREYYYAQGYIRKSPSWNALPETDDYRCLYGGDLQGVMEKLDYLQSLGVEAIYFNPIFISPSGHGYDTQDYYHIDPHLSNIPYNSGNVLREGDHDNRHASLYIRRTTAGVNLEASDAYFAKLCKEMHHRGMRIILDGVFNHCGSFNAWMDREGIYSRDTVPGAWQDVNSPYREYFNFWRPHEYYSWWGVETLPKLFYEKSRELCEKILAVAEKWVLPPYCIDGWRLDVAADLGMTREFNHKFWKAFRRRVKEANPEVLIIAEHYGDPSEWLGGDEWDSVMNYDAFMEPLTYFLTGMEKHSDYRRDDLFQNGNAFFEMILENMSRLPTPSVECAMDELSNHDHSRFMTRTNGMSGRLNSMGSEAASRGIRPGTFREAVLIQMTWPGAPTIYYGDEAGLTGWTDPDNRRTYPWGKEDQGLIEMHQAIARMRKAHPVLRRGSVKPLFSGYGVIAYGRFDADNALAVACNNTDIPEKVVLPLCQIGIEDGTPIQQVFRTMENGYEDIPKTVGTVEGGCLSLTIPEFSALVLTPIKEVEATKKSASA